MNEKCRSKSNGVFLLRCFRKVCCFGKIPKAGFFPHKAVFIELFGEQLFSMDKNILISY